MKFINELKNSQRSELRQSQNTACIFMLRAETHTEDCRNDFVLLLSLGCEATEPQLSSGWMATKPTELRLIWGMPDFSSEKLAFVPSGLADRGISCCGP